VSCRRRLWSAALLATGLALVAPARADERSEARRHFERGMAYIEKRDYDRGIAELERAYQILPHPSVRYNIARAHADAGNLEAAVKSYRMYLEKDPEDRAEVLKVVADLEERIQGQKAPPPEPQKPDPSKPGDGKPGDGKPGDGKPGDGGHKPPSPPKPPPQPPAASKPSDADVYSEQVVTASRSAQSPLDAPNSTTIITRQDIWLSGITRIPELLRRVAGMDVMQITGGDANVSVRGLNSRLSNKLMVLINGGALKNDLLGSTFWEMFPVDVDQIERIEVVRGPGSSLYGADAFAGVVNIITFAPGAGSSGGRGGLGDRGQAYGSVWASQRVGDFAFRASTGYTRYPRWTREVARGRADIEQGDADQNLGAENLRFDLRTALRLGKNRSIELGGGFARGTLDIYGIGPFNDYVVKADYGDVSAAFRIDFVTIRTSYNLLSAKATSNHAYKGHSLYQTSPQQHSFESNVELAHVFNKPKWLTQGLVGGVGYRLKKIDWNYLIDKPPIEHHVGVFAQDALRFHDRFGVTLSGRIDYVPVLRNIVPSARATLLGKPGATKRQAIKAAVATAFRTPTFLESYLNLPVQVQLNGLELQSSSTRDDDPGFKLGPENIVAAELEYLNQQSDSFQLEVAAYYHRISDRIILAPPRLTTLSDLANGVGGLNPETGRYRVASGGWENSCGIDHVFGGEVGGRFYGVEGLDLFANYAINYGIHQQRAGCLDPGDERTSHHKVNVGAQLRTSFGLNGEITFHYQTKQLWAEQVATLSGIEYQQFPLPAYHLLNGRIGYAFLSKKRAEVSAVIFNALSDLIAPAPQMHPFGNRVGRRFMAFFSYQL
jgi:iron complex outermembrane receptor protein